MSSQCPEKSVSESFQIDIPQAAITQGIPKLIKKEFKFLNSEGFSLKPSLEKCSNIEAVLDKDFSQAWEDCYGIPQVLLREVKLSKIGYPHPVEFQFSNIKHTDIELDNIEIQKEGDYFFSIKICLKSLKTQFRLKINDIWDPSKIFLEEEFLFSIQESLKEKENAFCLNYHFEMFPENQDKLLRIDRSEASFNIQNLNWNINFKNKEQQEQALIGVNLDVGKGNLNIETWNASVKNKEQQEHILTQSNLRYALDWIFYNTDIKKGLKNLDPNNVINEFLSKHISDIISKAFPRKEDRIFKKKVISFKESLFLISDKTELLSNFKKGEFYKNLSSWDINHYFESFSLEDGVFHLKVVTCFPSEDPNIAITKKSKASSGEFFANKDSKKLKSKPSYSNNHYKPFPVFGSPADPKPTAVKNIESKNKKPKSKFSYRESSYHNDHFPLPPFGPPADPKPTAVQNPEIVRDQQHQKLIEKPKSKFSYRESSYEKDHFPLPAFGPPADLEPTAVQNPEIVQEQQHQKLTEKPDKEFQKLEKIPQTCQLKKETNVGVKFTLKKINLFIQEGYKNEEGVRCGDSNRDLISCENTSEVHYVIKVLELPELIFNEQTREYFFKLNLKIKEIGLVGGIKSFIRFIDFLGLLSGFTAENFELHYPFGISHEGKKTRFIVKDPKVSVKGLENGMLTLGSLIGVSVFSFIPLLIIKPVVNSVLFQFYKNGFTDMSPGRIDEFYFDDICVSEDQNFQIYFDPLQF